MEKKLDMVKELDAAIESVRRAQNNQDDGGTVNRLCRDALTRLERIREQLSRDRSPFGR